GLTIKGAKHNVVYVATEANLVYAYDADDPSETAAPLWSKQLEAPLPLTFPSCGDLSASGQAGITSTPAISLEDNKIYVVSKTSGSQKLHALDLTTGDDVAGSPATVGMMGFDSNNHLNRPGLLLMNGVVYIAYGSHCDDSPYHG